MELNNLDDTDTLKKYIESVKKYEELIKSKQPNKEAIIAQGSIVLANAKSHFEAAGVPDELIKTLTGNLNTESLNEFKTNLETSVSRTLADRKRLKKEIYELQNEKMDLAKDRGELTKIDDNIETLRKELAEKDESLKILNDANKMVGKGQRNNVISAMYKVVAGFCGFLSAFTWALGSVLYNAVNAVLNTNSKLSLESLPKFVASNAGDILSSSSGGLIIKGSAGGLQGLFKSLPVASAKFNEWQRFSDNKEKNISFQALKDLLRGLVSIAKFNDKLAGMSGNKDNENLQKYPSILPMKNGSGPKLNSLAPEKPTEQVTAENTSKNSKRP